MCPVSNMVFLFKKFHYKTVFFAYSERSSKHGTALVLLNTEISLKEKKVCAWCFGSRNQNSFEKSHDNEAIPASNQFSYSALSHFCLCFLLILPPIIGTLLSLLPGHIESLGTFEKLKA